MKFKAVLFDLDGTLLNTLDDLADSMNASLKRFGFPPHPAATYRYLVGDGLVNLVSQALPEQHRDEATISKVATAQWEEYGRKWANKTQPYEGVPELLDALQERGIAISVLSNKPDDFTHIIVQKFLSNWKFAVVRGQNKDTPIKPNPSGANQIALKLGIPNSKFLYVGDSNTDMQTADAARMFAVGVLWGFRSRDELIAAGAKALIEKPADLLDLI
ncbi:MAG TPA: HAD family hydrolase [Candidatus Dormibacteraeota bacterium]|nr:HAD family hydrolase [Candidatus Dormibacteraeota bacterium]